MAALEDELHSSLDPGEKLLWSGRPVQGVVFAPPDWYLIPFSVVWLGLVLRGFWQGLTKTPDPMVGLVGVLFVGIGIYCLIGQFSSTRSTEPDLSTVSRIGELSSRRAGFVAPCNRSIYPRSVV